MCIRDSAVAEWLRQAGLDELGQRADGDAAAAAAAGAPAKK